MAWSPDPYRGSRSPSHLQRPRVREKGKAAHVRSEHRLVVTQDSFLLQDRRARARDWTPLGRRVDSAAGLAWLCWFQELSSAIFHSQTNWDRLGTLMLRSPMLMFRGISGRLMFFTADTARAGAAERPPSDFSSLF